MGSIRFAQYVFQLLRFSFFGRATYVLIHGAWHGAWCWEKVMPLIKAAGHTVIAPDLPGHGRDKTPIPEVTLKAYVQRVCEAVNTQTEPVILVGHSMAGVVITQAAEDCPDRIKMLVYLCAYLPRNGESLFDLLQQDNESLSVQNRVLSDDKSYITIRDDAIKEVFYADCSDDDVERARTLLRPQATVPTREPVHTTDKNFGRLSRVYIETLRDRAISPSLQRQMVAASPCQKVITMDTSHSPFFSAPEELVAYLTSL
jgi:pimeloyl-ACP methyl ester carboxylesterase